MAKRRRYSPEEIERGLTTLILAGSSTRAEDVCGVPASTLREWKLDHPDQYERLEKDLEPRVVDKIAAQAEGIVLELADVQRGYIARMRDTMHELKPGEIPGAMRNAATAAALNIDKLSSPLRERPSHVQHQTGLEQVLARIGREMGLTIDSTAEDADIISLPLQTEGDDRNAHEPIPRANPAT